VLITELCIGVQAFNKNNFSIMESNYPINFNGHHYSVSSKESSRSNIKETEQKAQPLQTSWQIV
jgi:hypothetical protein